jgi:hypothetical protein
MPTMLYVATVHYKSPRWVEIQTSHLRRHIPVEFEVWSSLQDIDPRYGAHFDRIVDQRGSHAGKLNHLATEIAEEAADSDLLMFLDGDAFPVADPMPLISEGLREAPLMAVRRAENGDEPQPHPCFCVTTVGTWRRLPGDWTAGATWLGVGGNRTSDVGGNLLRRLELTGTPWTEVLRSSGSRVDPLYFGVYGGAIYHHGAGFRTGELSPAHRRLAPARLSLPDAPLLRPATRALNRARWIWWERRTERRLVRESERIFDEIQRGGADWLSALTEGAHPSR